METTTTLNIVVKIKPMKFFCVPHLKISNFKYLMSRKRQCMTRCMNVVKAKEVYQATKLWTKVIWGINRLITLLTAKGNNVIGGVVVVVAIFLDYYIDPFKCLSNIIE